MLKRAIQSILNQSYQNWQMVIVNDGGNPAEVNQVVQEYHREFKNRLLVIHNETSLGMEAASNKGIKRSTGDYVVIHDDDDTWDNSFITRCVEQLEKLKGTNYKGIVTRSVKVLETIQDNQIIINDREPYNDWLNMITLSRMAAENMFAPISFLYKREVFDVIGYYDENLPVLGDWEFNLRFLLNFDIYVIPEKLANYHHRVQITQTNDQYGNSILSGSSKHLDYDTRLRNYLLRKDIQNSQVGLGFLVNIFRSFLDEENQGRNIIHDIGFHSRYTQDMDARLTKDLSERIDNTYHRVELLDSRIGNELTGRANSIYQKIENDNILLDKKLECLANQINNIQTQLNKFDSFLQRVKNFKLWRWFFKSR